MEILFRLDVNETIGAGHFERCMTLANAIKQCHKSANLHIHFCCSALPEVYKQRLQAMSYSYINVPRDVSPQAEANLIQNIFEKSIDYIFVDSYSLGEQWQNQVKPLCRKLIAFDDLPNRNHGEIDFLIDQTFGAHEDDYRGKLHKNTLCMCGSQYSLLRDEFSKSRLSALEKRASTQVPEKIVIALGAMNTGEYTLQFIEYVERVNYQQNLSLDIKIILSSKASGLTHVKNFVDKHDNIELLLDCSNMAEQYSNADIAIGACGTSSWERSILGLPTLAVTLADNQAVIAKQLAQADAHYYLGHAKDVSFEHFSVYFLKLLNYPNCYQSLSKNARNIVDGLGTSRIIQKLSLDEIVLSKATHQDTDTIFGWSSNAQIRQYARNTQPITYETHTEWMKKTLADPKRHLFIIQSVTHQQSVDIGILRLDKLSNGYEVSILTDPNWQKRGVAERALNAIDVEYRCEDIYATVLKPNTASHRLFVKAGYLKVGPELYVLPKLKKEAS